ncbi:MAG: hypothetical protein AAFQ58_08760 [Pseudomonadota bacterium]
MRRKITITAHWLSFVFLVLLIAGGPIGLLGWSFALSGLVMCAPALISGVMNGPGPKLRGPLRAAHPWLSRAMYLALGAIAALTLWHLLRGTWPGGTLPNLYFYLLMVSALHAVFHLWRHTALGDGALRRITPKSMHNIL